MPSRYQLLEHLAQHLRVHRDLDIEGRRLQHGEVEAVEQVAQDRLDGLVRTVTPPRLSRSVFSNSPPLRNGTSPKTEAM